MNTSIENIVYTEFTKKKVFEQLTLVVVSPARCRHGRKKVSIPEVRPNRQESNGGALLKPFCLVALGDRHFCHDGCDGDTATNVSWSKTFFW